MSDVSYALSQLNETVNSFQSNINVHIQSIDRSSQQVEATAKQIYDNIVRFRSDMEHGEQKQLAHENIIRIDQTIKEQFGDYETIRRTVIGVVRDFDINLVRNSTIQELSEELWITSSRYWLSYALIAITAWVNNYPEVAKSALSECGRKDPIKTTLFFTLLNLRFARNETAKNWFCEYIKTLDPTRLQNETAIMIQAYLNGLFGPDKELEYKVITLIDQWIAEIKGNEALNKELAGIYFTYMSNINPQVKFEYTAILNNCTNQKDYVQAFNNVSKYKKLLEKVKEFDVEVAAQTDDNYKERIDSVLISLITNYDEEELEIRNQQQYYRLVVENEGHVDIAKTQYDNEMALQNSTFNIGKQMIQWAIYDNDSETNKYVRKFGFVNTKQWFSEALLQWKEKVSRERPYQCNLSIDEWQGVSHGNDAQEMRESLSNFFESIKFKSIYVNTINAVCVLVALIAIVLGFLVTPFAFIAVAVAAGVMIFNILKKKKDFPIRVQNAQAALEQTLAQVEEFNRYCDETSVLSDEIMGITEFI